MKTKLLLEKKQYFLDIIKHAEDAITEIDEALTYTETNAQVGRAFRAFCRTTFTGNSPEKITSLEPDTEYAATFRGYDDLTDNNVVITKAIK